MITNNSIIDDAYNQLSDAYYIKRDRKAIEESCKHCQSLGIPRFQELANEEMTKLYSYRRIKTYPLQTPIECLPPAVLGMYALACMNVLFKMSIESIRRDCQYAYQKLSQPVQFHSTDVLYMQKEKQLTVLNDVTGDNFISAMTLLVTYKKSLTGKGAVSCKKRDILKLDFSDYKDNHDALVSGFESAASFLVHQGIYRENDLPYTTQLVPLAAIFAFDNEKKDNRAFMLASNKDLLAKWYWCGVFGELYGGANEARFALDIADMFKWIKGGDVPDTVSRASFVPTRLLSMQTRNSAAYKGVMAIVMQDSPLDFMSGEKMDVAKYLDEDTDIHHIFPQAYCEKQKYPQKKWNSVINKTPIYASSNRSIGGRAPSEYLKTMKKKGLDEKMVVSAVSSHKVNYEYLSKNMFDEYFVDRAKKLLDRIELAMGKNISGRDSEETIKEFGVKLI